MTRPTLRAHLTRAAERALVAWWALVVVGVLLWLLPMSVRAA